MLCHSVLVLKDWAAETYWCRQLMMQTCCHIHHISMRAHNVTHIILPSHRYVRMCQIL